MDYTTPFPVVQEGATVIPVIAADNIVASIVSHPSSPSNQTPLSSQPNTPPTTTPATIVNTDSHVSVVPQTTKTSTVPSHDHEVNASTSQPPSPVAANATPFSTFPSVEVSSMDDVSVDANDTLFLTHPPPDPLCKPTLVGWEPQDGEQTAAQSQHQRNSVTESSGLGVHASTPLHNHCDVQTASCQTIDVIISECPPSSFPSVRLLQDGGGGDNATSESGDTSPSFTQPKWHAPLVVMNNAGSQTCWDSNSGQSSVDAAASASVSNSNITEPERTLHSSGIPSNDAVSTEPSASAALKAMQSELEELRASECTSRRRNEYLMSALSKRSEELARVSKLLDNANNQLAELHISQSAAAVALKAQQAARYASITAVPSTHQSPSTLGEIRVVGGIGEMIDPSRKDGGEDSQPGDNSAALGPPLPTNTNGEAKSNPPVIVSSATTGGKQYPAKSFPSRASGATTNVTTSSMKQSALAGTASTTARAGHLPTGLSSTQRSNVQSSSSAQFQSSPASGMGKSVSSLDVKGIAKTTSLGSTTMSTGASRRPGTLGGSIKTSATTVTATPTTTRQLPTTLKPRK